jgi:TATA-box binding protein (TBP) (component of TFIID and TFIIIB)
MDFDIDTEWESFLETNEIGEMLDTKVVDSTEVPVTDPLYISTKSLIKYLSTTIDIVDLFWSIPIMEYSRPSEGVIKKQMKFTSFTPESLRGIKDRLSNETVYVDEQINYTIDNPDGRIQFKDVRKISIGLSKRDLISPKSRKIGAFYNCLAIILRIQMPLEESFREMHVKLFNTGKVEIPGIQSTEHEEYVLQKVVDVLNSNIQNSVPITFRSDHTEIVLINSNFNCNFYINRDILYDILQKKYSIKCVYEPCSYPGIQCKYILAPKVEVSYMIFRTGSVLIVGKCSEEEIYRIYEYVKQILYDEYPNIHQIQAIPSSETIPKKPKKVKTKTIHFYEV